jgi:hypothetical protein
MRWGTLLRACFCVTLYKSMQYMIGRALQVRLVFQAVPKFDSLTYFRLHYPGPALDDI